MNITVPVSPRGRSPVDSPRRNLPVAGRQRCPSPSVSPRAGHGNNTHPQPASAVVGTAGVSAQLSNLGLRSERRRRRSDDDLSFLMGHVPQAHMLPRAPSGDPEERLAALVSFDGEEHKVPTKDIHAAATRVEDMLASFDGDAFSAVELHGSSYEQAAQLPALIPTRSSRRMTMRGGVSTPTVAAATSTAVAIEGGPAAERAPDSQKPPASQSSAAAAAAGGGAEAPVTSDLWSVVSQHTNQLSAKLKASHRQQRGGDSWQQPGGMVSAMDTHERAEQQRQGNQATKAATGSAATAADLVQQQEAQPSAAAGTNRRAAQQPEALKNASDANEGTSSSSVTAAAAGGVAVAAAASGHSGEQDAGKRSLRRALAKVYERVL